MFAAAADSPLLQSNINSFQCSKVILALGDHNRRNVSNFSALNLSKISVNGPITSY